MTRCDRRVRSRQLQYDMVVCPKTCLLFCYTYLKVCTFSSPPLGNIISKHRYYRRHGVQYAGTASKNKKASFFIDDQVALCSEKYNFRQKQELVSTTQIGSRSSPGAAEGNINVHMSIAYTNIQITLCLPRGKQGQFLQSASSSRVIISN